MMKHFEHLPQQQNKQNVFPYLLLSISSQITLRIAQDLSLSLIRCILSLNVRNVKVKAKCDNLEFIYGNL
jgi:hypothetical protein